MADLKGQQAATESEDSMPITEQCFCPSYYDDKNILQGCTCGKCTTMTKFIVQKDGNKWFAADESFKNLQESKVAWGDTPTSALSDFLGLGKPHRFSQAPYTIHDLGYLEQCLRYHKSVEAQLEEDIAELKKRKAK